MQLFLLKPIILSFWFLYWGLRRAQESLYEIVDFTKELPPILTLFCLSINVSLQLPQYPLMKIKVF